MTETRTFWESIKVEGGELLEQVKRLIHEGNVRRIVIRQGDRSVAEFPLTVGLVGTLGAPILAAVGALAALLTQCSIAVEREAPAESAAAPAAPTVPDAAAVTDVPPPPADPIRSDPIFRDDIPPQA